MITIYGLDENLTYEEVGALELLRSQGVLIRSLLPPETTEGELHAAKVVLSQFYVDVQRCGPEEIEKSDVLVSFGKPQIFDLVRKFQISPKYMVFGADGVSPTKAETAALTDGIINEVFTKSSRYASEYVRELVRSANRGVEHRVGYAPYCNSLSDFCGFKFTRKPENKDFIILRDTPDLEDFCFEDHWRMVCGITASRPKQFRALSWGKKLSKKAGNPGNPKDKWNGELSASILHASPTWDEKREAYSESSVLLHFYPAVESFSFAAARAMLSGAVVVASPSSQFYDLVSHGETGLIANTPDEAAYLSSRLAWEPHLQAKIAHDAHKWIVAKGPANADVCLNWWKPIICRTT
jgi:glycosyltransferase involved in cell wall biosynthesis